MRTHKSEKLPVARQNRHTMTMAQHTKYDNTLKATKYT